MGSLIDTAVAHFSNRATRSLEVPEWEVTVYAKNLSLKDKADWLSKADGDAPKYLCYAIIYGLADENGEKLFSIADLHKLQNNVDPDIVNRLANFVLVADVPNEEGREKN